MTEVKQRLDATNIQLGKELWLIHSSLAIYRVIGLNAKAMPAGDSFFGFVQNQSLSAVALGLGKVFEREQRDGYELCSVGGVFRLAKAVPIQNRSAAAEFVRRYGVNPSADWISDVDEVFSSQRPRIAAHMQAIDSVKNTLLAHIQQKAPESNLPSIAAFEELLSFAFGVHSFINEAFLNVHSHPTLTDRQVETGLLRTLKAIGVTGPRSEFSDI